MEEEVALAAKGRHTDAIFSYLTGNRISEACRLAQKEGEERQTDLLASLASVPANPNPSVPRRPPSVPAAVPGRGLSVLQRPAGPPARRLEPHADRQLPARGTAAHLHAALRETRTHTLRFSSCVDAQIPSYVCGSPAPQT